MTLSNYSAETLDELALRLLDLAGQVRNMAHGSREHGLHAFQLHGNKVNEWLVQVENWTHDAAGRMEAAIKKQQGARRAQQLALPAGGKAARRKRG